MMSSTPGPPALHDGDRSVPAVFAEWVGRRPDAVALRTVAATGIDDWTYQRLWDHVREIRDVAFSGLSAGIRIPMALPGGADYVAGMLAALAAGLIPVPVYLPSTREPQRFLARAQHILRDCEPSAVYTCGELVEVLERDPILGALPIRTPASTADGLAPHPGGTTADADHGEHVAFLQYSSGSTGKPKGVVNTHQSILRQAAFAANVWNGDDDMHMVSWLPLYHDMGIFWGVFMPLLNGGCTTLIPPHDFVRNPRIWLETVSRFRGNWIGGPDFAYRRCIEAFDGTALQSLDLSCLRLATNGAEPVRGTTLRDFTAKFRAAGLRDDVMAPQYGLAEAGLGVTGSQTVRVWVEKSFDADALERGIAVEVAQPNPADGRSRALVSCGDGAFGWDIQIVDPDRHMTLTDGEVGEIWVGGPGLPDGYWRQPEQTATTFGARTADGLGPYLRTGDAGFRYQGELYVCGRYRDLIIVGGRNHFPNDIEKTVEEAHCGVAPGGACAVQPDAPQANGEWWLVLETGSPVEDLDDLSRILRRRILAHHETAPERVVWVPCRTLPTTTSGKIRRRETLNRLTAGQLEVVHEVSPRAQAPDTPAAPDDPPTELAQHLAAMLGVEPYELAPDADLTTLGLTSMMTAQIVEWSSSQSRRLDFADLYAEPTLRSWQRLFDAAPPVQTGTSSVAASGPWPTTPLQQAYWVGRGAEQPLGGVGCQTYFELVGARVDAGRLAAALDALTRRHPMLRATFPDPGRCLITPEAVRLPLAVHDLTDAPVTTRDTHLAEIRRRLRTHRFDIETGDTWTVELTRLPHGCIVHFAVDLIIADVTSIGTMLRDLAASYRGEKLPAPSATFADLIQSTSPPPQACADRLPEGPQLPRVQEADISFLRHQHTLSALATKAIDDACHNHGVTRAAVLLAAYTLVLRRWASQDDFLVNVTTFGRSPEVSDVVGDFTETHLYRAQLDGQISFVDQAQVTQKGLRTALRAAPAPDLLATQLRSGTGHSGIVPVVFTYAADSPLLSAEDANTLGAIDEVVSMTPQVLIDHQACRLGDDVVLSWDYRAGCFPPGVVDDMFEAYVTLLERLGGHDWSTPATPGLSAHSRLARAHRNATTTPAPAGLLYDAFRENAATHPARLALRWRPDDYRGERHGDVIAQDRSQLTYGELDELARSVARAVAARHAAGSVIGIQLPKGPSQIVAVLGVMMAGCTYLPVGVDQPAERLSRICARSAMAGLIRTDSDTQDAGVAVSDITAMIECAPTDPIRIDPHDAAYVIYTSGSTGEPKGVLVSHAAALNTIVDVNRRNRIDTHDRLLALSALDFDLSVYDTFGALGCGAQLVTIPEHARRDAFHWLSLTTEFGITVWNSVPGLMDMLLIAAGDKAGSLPTLRSVFLSGDWIPLDLPRRLRRAAPGVRLVAMGGATEAAIWSNEFVVDDVDPDWASIPYGYPLANQMFRVVDDNGDDQPDYVAGELWIGGAGVALGYHNAPELTSDRFVHDPTGSRWYRTGDMGCYWRDGTLQFLGRADSQVKIRGHRVECGEIEHALRGHPLVAAATVVPIHNCTALGAGIVVTGSGAEQFDDSTPGALRAHLAVRLPQYMIPKVFVSCPELPLTANGKVDRGKIAARLEAAARAPQPLDTSSTLTVVERLVAEVWSDVLGAPITGREDNFFAQGGDSLRATEAVARLTRRGVAGAEVGQLLSHQTLGQFSAACVLADPASEASESAADVGEPVTPGEGFPLTRLQQAYTLGAAGLNGSTCAPTYFAVVLAAAPESAGIDLDRFARVVTRCVDEFAMLRCALDADTTQRVQVDAGPVPVHDLDIQDDPDLLLRRMAAAPFDPHSVPVIQCFAPSRSPRHVGLLISYLGLDARSLSTVVTTIIAEYQSQPRPRQVDPTAAVFARFASESAWGENDVDNSVAGPPLLPLHDQRRDPFERVTFARRSFTIEEQAAATLREHAAHLGVTPTALVFEAFAHALASIGAGQRFAVTVPKSYRPDYAPADREVLGNFTRLALCEVDYGAVRPGSAEAVAAAQRELWRAVSHDGDITGGLAATRTAGGYPVVFTSTLGLTHQDASGLTNVRTLTQTPGVWLDCQTEDEVAGIRMSWDIATNVVAAESISVAFSRFEEAVRRHAGQAEPPGTAVAPAVGGSPGPEWASAVIAAALRHCRPEQVLPQYTMLVRRWEALRYVPSGYAASDVERAARRLAGIVTGAVSPQTLIGDPQLTPEALLLRDDRMRMALDDLAGAIFGHARTLGRRLRVVEVGSRTGLITERLTELVGVVVEEYLCLEPNPTLAGIAAGRRFPAPTRHVDAPDAASGVDVVICCGSLHQLPDAEAVLEAITVSDDGWLWMVENSEATQATLISAAVLDPGLLASDSKTLRPADRWWRLIADHGWRPTHMIQDGPGLTLIAHRPDKPGMPTPPAEQRRDGRWSRPAVPASSLPTDATVVATLAEIWQRHLAIPTPGVDDDFFLLGGDSLVATRVYADLRAAGFGQLAFVDLFNHSTLGELAAHAGPRTGPEVSVAAESTRGGTHDPNRFPLTVVQNAYRAGREGALILGGVAAHCYFEFELADFDRPRFDSAARQLVARHAGLRTTVSPAGTDAASSGEVAVVHTAPIEPVVRDHDDVRAAMRDQIIDLTARPGIDFGVQTRGDGRTVVGISMDNTMLDGASMMIALSELDHLYRGETVDQLPPLETSFAHYVWNHPELLPDADEAVLPRLAASRDYWRARLPSLPPAPKLADMSLLFEIEEPRFERATATIPAVDWSQVTRSCRAEGVTVASFLLANYARVLSRWSGTDHFCINVTLFDRDPDVVGIENVVGDFTSLVLLECRVDEPASIWESVRALQRQLMTDLPHRGADAVWLQRELLRFHGNPTAALVPVVFTSGLGLVDASARAAVRFAEPVFAASQTPQTVLDFQVWESAGALKLSWDFVSQAVSPATARTQLESLVDGITGVATRSRRIEHKLGEGASNDELLQRVSRICASALGQPRVEPHDNFFQLGGDSVSATKVVEQIGRELSASATLRLLFANPVIGDFAAKIADTDNADEPDLTVEEGML